MDDAKNGYQATPNAALEQQGDTCPTCGSECNERDELTKAEREIERLRAEVASLTAQLQSGESFHAVAVHQRDAAWGEVETLKATLTQQCKGFRADVEKLEAEVEALRASAERWIYINERNGEWRRFEGDGPDPAYSMLCVRLPYDADLSCRATREIAIDAARWRGSDGPNMARIHCRDVRRHEPDRVDLVV